jgi:hypothetical protein
VQHCCVFPCVVCHWHRYVILMTCAPHLSFLVVIFSLIMVWVACMRVSCVEDVGLHDSDVSECLLCLLWVVHVVE